MKNNIIDSLFSGLISWFLEKRKERRENEKEREAEKKKVYQERPELKIIDYDNDFNNPGYRLNEKCDIDIFMTKIESMSVNDELKKVLYNKEFLNEQNWCCVIYKFENVGKTDIRHLCLKCNDKKNVILCDTNCLETLCKHDLLTNSTWCFFDKKIYVHDIFTLKVCFHEECVIQGMITAATNISFEDANGNYWEQPLFVPENKINESYRITHEEYKNNFVIR